MKGIGNTKDQLTDEVRSLRQKIAELEARVTVGKQAEEELRESEKKYRRLVESLERDYIIYSHDIQGVFTYLSPSIVNVLGYTQDEFMGHYAEYLTDSPINKDVERYTNAGLRGEKQLPYEAEFWHKDGSRRHLEVTEVPVYDNKGNVQGIEGIVHDITERKKAEEELRKYRDHLEELVEERTDEITKANEQLQQEIEIRKQAEGKLKESEEGYRNLIETSPDAIFVHIDQKIVFMNPAGLEILGAHNSSEIIGKSILDLTHPDYLEVIKRRQELLKKGEAPRNEYFKAIRLDGSVIDVELTTARVTYQGKSAIMAIATDITERKQAEGKLKESEEGYRKLIETSPYTIFVHVDQKII